MSDLQLLILAIAASAVFVAFITRTVQQGGTMDPSIGYALVFGFTRALPLIRVLWPLVLELVEELEDEDASGEAKRATAIGLAARGLDDLGDEIPIWANLGEDVRDRLLGGMVEVALIVSRGSDERQARRKARRAARKARRSEEG